MTTPELVVDSLPLHEPASVAEAADLHLRLRVLGEWASTRRDAVTAWLLARGEERIEVDGAAPTWRLDAGTVVVTDPDPKPRIVDTEAFGRWLLAAMGEPTAALTPQCPQFDCQWLSVRLVPTVSSDDLLEFARARACDFSHAGDDLEAAIVWREEWFVDDDVLTAVIDDGEATVVHSDGRWLLVDSETGEVVPGVEVAAPQPRRVQVRPSSQARSRVRGELEGLLGVPELDTGGA